MRLELGVAATRDLRTIFTWTERNFGLAQAASYQNALNAACRSAADRPTSGREYTGAADGTRRVACGRHFIYFRSTGDAVRIIRILHQRMLQDAHIR